MHALRSFITFIGFSIQRIPLNVIIIFLSNIFTDKRFYSIIVHLVAYEIFFLHASCVLHIVMG